MSYTTAKHKTWTNFYRWVQALQAGDAARGTTTGPDRNPVELYLMRPRPLVRRGDAVVDALVAGTRYLTYARNGRKVRAELPRAFHRFVRDYEAVTMHGELSWDQVYSLCRGISISKPARGRTVPVQMCLPLISRRRTSTKATPSRVRTA